MALLDGEYSEVEVALIKHMADSSCLTDSTLAKIYKEIESPHSQNVDLSLFKGDEVMSLSLLSGLSSMAKVDGAVAPVEQLYLMKIGSALGVDPASIQLMLS